MNTDFWKQRDTLTIDQAVILALGSDPYNKELIASQSQASLDLKKKLTDCVQLDKKIITQLLEQKYHEHDDELAILNNACFDHGVTFFRSIIKNDFAALDLTIHPEVNSLELEVSEVKVWLKSVNIRPEFFFPDEFDVDFSISKNGAPQDLSVKERDTLLVLLAAALKANKIDYEQRGVSSAVQAMTEILGVSITEDTIRKFLKQIPAAVERRTK